MYDEKCKYIEELSDQIELKKTPQEIEEARKIHKLTNAQLHFELYNNLQSAYNAVAEMINRIYHGKGEIDTYTLIRLYDIKEDIWNIIDSEK